MKKYALFLIGMCALVLTSVIFAACEKKKDAGTEDSSKLIGTWQYTDETYSYTVSFRSDNSGKMRFKDSYYGTSYSENFDYKYDESTKILKMHIAGSTMEYRLDWYGDDKVYLIYIYDGHEEEELGPFIRISNEPEEENTPIPNPGENYDNTKIKGTWKLTETFGDYNQYTQTMTIVLKADNTGTMSVYDTYYNQTNTSSLTYNFTPSTNILNLYVYNEAGESDYLKCKVFWYNDNKVDLYILVDDIIYEDYKMGPFIRQ